MKEENILSKVFYPDCIFDLNQISTSTFLYFKEPISMTLHPTVSIFNTGCDPYKFMEILNSQKIFGTNHLNFFFEVFEKSSKSIHDTSTILEPIQKNGYIKSIWLAYSRNARAFEESKKIIEKSKLSIDQIFELIDPTMAIQELMSHILYERFLELYGDRIKINAHLDKNSSYEDTRAKNIDYLELIEYTENLLKKNQPKELLVWSYLFRLQSLRYFKDILLTNNKLLPFLESIEEIDKVEGSNYDDLDVVSWEIFRQLTSQYLEKKSHQDQIDLISTLRKHSDDEINMLKLKCLKLAEEFKGDKSAANFEKNIAQHVRIHTEKEIIELLKLDRKSMQAIIDSIFSDEKSWLAMSAFIASLINGNTLFSASAGVATITYLGSKTYKQVAENRKNMKENDFALIYRLNNK